MIEIGADVVEKQRGQEQPGSFHFRYYRLMQMGLIIELSTRPESLFVAVSFGRRHLSLFLSLLIRSVS